MKNLEIQYNTVRGEGRSSEITVATGTKTREPKTYLLLVVGQTIGLLSHVTEKSNDLARLTNTVNYFRVEFIGSRNCVPTNGVCHQESDSTGSVVLKVG